MSEWTKLGRHPRDGQHVLAWSDDDESKCQWLVHRRDGQWFHVIPGHTVEYEYEVTHWRHLSDPPE